MRNCNEVVPLNDETVTAYCTYALHWTEQDLSAAFLDSQEKSLTIFLRYVNSEFYLSTLRFFMIKFCPKTLSFHGDQFFLQYFSE